MTTKTTAHDRTRWQILFTGTSTIENFTTYQLKKYHARKRQLKELGIPFTTWDTRKNTLSNLFRS